jgi:tRNA A-37 threonylcarbamoyl transferase component Bud32
VPADRDRTQTRPVGGRYELQRLLGRGGMGSVWRAEDLLLRRPVAVKRVELPPHLPDDERDTIRQRVLREARAAARLNHPRLVTIFDVVEEDGTVFLVQELVDAPTLKDLVAERGPLPPAEVAAIGRQLVDGLDAAHRSGVVHRDVKPGNVMVRDDGSVKLADFGIASVQGDPNLTATGVIIGSPAYMAPEQATGATVTAAADLWSLGATLYFAVEGEAPFGKADTLSTLTAVVHDPPRQPLRAGPLAPVFERLLAKDPAERPNAAELTRLLAAGGDATVAVSRTQPMTRPVVVRAPAPPAASTISSRSGAPTAPERDQMGREPRRRSFPLGGALALITLLLVAAFAYVALAGDNTTSGSNGTTATSAATTTAPPSTTAAKASTTTEAQPTTTTAASGAAEAATPAGWTAYRDDATGYVLAYPSGWQVKDRAGNRTDFVDPATGTYLRVEWTDKPGDSAQAAWEQQSKDFAKSHDGYEELGITPTTYKGSTNASLWEYRYRSGSATLHAADLGFVLPSKRYGFALNFQTNESQWQPQQPTWEQLKAAFTPPA